MHSRRPENSERAEGAPGAVDMNPRRILFWVYLGRISFAASLLLLTPVVDGGPYLGLPTILVLFTLGSYIFSHIRHRPLTWPFLYSQVVFDAILLTGAVYLTGGRASIFAPLYILVISAGALLLPMRGGIFLGLLTSLLYFTAAVATSGTIDPGVTLLALLIAVIAAVTSYLGDRLRKAGAALGEAQTELRLLRLGTDDILATIGTGVIMIDGEGRLAYANPAAVDMLGILPDQWLGSPVLDELDRIAPGLGDVIRRTASTRTPIRRFETEPLADETFVLGVSTTLLAATEETNPPVTAIFQDITQRKRVEGLRRRAERLEAVAELSASLAHEIKNPLASIRSAVEQLAAGELDPDDIRILSSLIVRESDRVSRLLGEFIDFARVKVTAPEPVDFTALVSGVVDMVRAHPDSHGAEMTISLESSETPVLIRGDEDLLHRAVFNLALNAVQWAGVGGRVTLSLGEVRSDLLSPALGTFRLVRLAVRDSGPGVPEEIREHIFDPFFTRRQGGTGLGLALVQRAVEAHGGAIFVDNEHGGVGGAVFSLYLPTLPLGPSTMEASSFLAEANEL